MKNYSNVIAGLALSVGGILLVQFGFSENCSSEILAKVLPLIGAAPGLVMAYIARIAKGDVKLSGVRK
jgi:hypothetical protein